MSGRTDTPPESVNELRANPPQLLLLSEAAIVVGLSKRTIQRLIANKQLRACRLGRRRTIIKREDLFKYVDSLITGEKTGV